MIVGPPVASTVCPNGRSTTGGLGDGFFDAPSVAGLLVPRPRIVEVHVDAVGHGDLARLGVLNLLPLPLLVAALERHGLAAASLDVVLRLVSPSLPFFARAFFGNKHTSMPLHQPSESWPVGVIWTIQLSQSAPLLCL